MNCGMHVHCTMYSALPIDKINKQKNQVIPFGWQNQMNRNANMTKKQLLIRWRSRVCTSAPAVSYLAVVHVISRFDAFSSQMSVFFSNSQYFFFTHLSATKLVRVCVCMPLYMHFWANCVCVVRIKMCLIHL